VRVEELERAMAGAECSDWLLEKARMSQTSKTKGILRWEQSMNKCREILDSLSPTNGCDSVL
jgi:hypothetical protein